MMEANPVLEILRSQQGLLAAGAGIQIALIRYGIAPKGTRWWLYHSAGTATGLLIANALAG